MKFKVLKAAIIGLVLTLSGFITSAHATLITLGASDYEVITVTGLHSDYTALIESTPWWGSQTIAKDAAEQLFASLGSNDIKFSYELAGGNANAMFYYAPQNQVTRWYYTPSVHQSQFAVVIPQAVPEPSTLAVFALGMIGLASRRFKKQS